MHTRSSQTQVYYVRACALAQRFLLVCMLSFLSLFDEDHVLHAQPIAREHLIVELVAQNTALLPGSSAWLGLRLQHEEHWHTYWTNPGDSGLPTRLAWRLPEGLSVDDIAWPAPRRLIVGELHNFGFEGEMLLPVLVHIPRSARPGDRLELQLDANWLVCKEECIPDRASLSLKLPVAEQASADTRWSALFAEAIAAQPAKPAWKAIATVRDTTVSIRIEGNDLPGAEHLDAFALRPQLLSNGAVRIVRESDALLIETALSEYFANTPEQLDLVLVRRHDASMQAWQVAATWGGASNAATAGAASSTAIAQDWSDRAGSFGAAFLLALFGGVLLNLMPCVFPVLSLKALTIAESAHTPQLARREGMAYAAGCIAGFLVLATVLIGLRAAGASLGWGFQLQSPLLVAALVYLMVGLGLGLSGIYVFGARLSGVGQSLTEGHGPRAAFFTGVLACVVASPCTAPFMGPALGYALTQPALAALAVFAALGIGLALPILLLGWLPALGRLLPRPGAWMDQLKQLLAWPLYLTAVWLLWVLMQQAGADTTALTLVGIVLFIAVLVWYGRAQFREMLWPRRLAMLLLFGLALAPLLQVSSSSSKALAAEGSTWQPWSPQRLDNAIAADQAVFVNMTAAWCITCLANERVALSSDAFKAALRDEEVLYLKGDWTNQNADITAYLGQFGRSGVPLYVVYPKGGGAPEVLPQLLTPGLVNDALRRATTGSSISTASRSVP